MGRAWRRASLLLIAALDECKGNGARSKQGNGDGGDRSSIAIAMAMGKEDWGKGTGAGATGATGATAIAMAMGQEEWGNGVPIAIDRVDVVAVGCGRGHLLFRVLFENVRAFTNYI
jgi:hypothetical protein